MAGAEQQGVQDTADGAVAEGQIAVENPATGALVAHVPDLGPEAIAELARKGRAAQVGWEAIGFSGRSRVMLRAQKWVIDNHKRVIETIVSETGKSWEDAQVAEL